MPTIADIYYHLYQGSRPSRGPAVVLIHGAGGTHLYWPAELRRLPGQLVYAPDLPGHGKSGGRGQQSIAAYAESIQEWLNSLGIHSAVFVGHSMGSAIALTLALDYPQRVNGLVLVGGGAKLRVAAQLMDAVSSPSTYLSAVRMVVEWSFNLETPQTLKDLAEKRMAETRPSVLAADFKACNEFDVTERLEEIQKPTLILCGVEDKMTPSRYSNYLADKIANAELALIPQAGHMVQLEQPRLVLEKIQGFLGRIHYQEMGLVDSQ